MCIIVVLGTVFGLPRERVRACVEVLEHLVLPLAQQGQGAILSPALQGGITHLLGQASLNRAQRNPPIIGVTLDADAYYEGKPDDLNLVDLESNHTDFVLVPGSDRRVLPYWRSRIATVLAEMGDAQTKPSVTLVIGGQSDTTWDEIAASVEVGRPVVALQGMGAVADELGRVLEGKTMPDAHPLLPQLLRSGLLQAVPLVETQSIGTVLRTLLLRAP